MKLIREVRFNGFWYPFWTRKLWKFLSWDRSLPYEKGEGTYSCPENDRVTYSVNEILTSDKGISFNVEANHSALIITLEGEQVVSSNDVDKVFILSEGRFLLLNEGFWRIAMTPNLPAQIKYCVFNW